MAQSSSGKSLFKEKDVSTAVQTPESYLKLAKTCMEHVQRMTSQGHSTPLQFNHGQCEYLANKLEVVVQSAEARVLSCLQKDAAECIKVEPMRLLWRSATDVESFIQCCGKQNWIQAAMVMANMSEQVSQLSSNLDFCTLLLSDNNKNNDTWGKAWRALTDLESSIVTNSVAVKELVSQDRCTLLARLETVRIFSSDSSIQEFQLAKCLSRRLSQYMSGHSVRLSDWEIQYSSLTPKLILGRGSAGTVYKSSWLGEEVAVKEFYGANNTSFQNEVKILAALAHPNIVSLLGYTTARIRCSVVMELMDRDLYSLMEERKWQNHTSTVPFTIFEAVDMMLQTAGGMLYLHENAVVHRDLRSQNILVKIREDIDAQYFCVKVADFGLAKTRVSSNFGSNLGADRGATRWMAPELMFPVKDDQRARTSDRDQELRHPFKVDVYSFGVVCYEILTGKCLFRPLAP